MRLWLAALLFTLFCPVAFAAPAESTYRRLVNFEWDAIENAKSYEIELTQSTDSKDDKPKIFTFKTKEPAWNGRLTPGKYLMKLRSRDYRGVPGEWSPDSDFNVGLENVVLKSPASRSKFVSKDNATTNLNFEWAAVGGAEKYFFELTSEDGKTTITKELSETSLKLDVPVAQGYTWKVSAQDAKGVPSDAVSVAQFTILGAPIAKPAIARLESEYVRELKWTRPDNTESYDVYLLKADEASKKWVKYKTFKEYKEDNLPFDETWPGGRYQLVVRAKGNLRKGSEVTKHNFKVHNGNRSPASEYTALVRKSIDRVTGWYGMASYLVTQINYKSTNPQNNSRVAYDALGGTGRIGLGWFSPQTPWGFLSIIDFSGFTFNGTVKSYASAEFNAVYRQATGDRGEFRAQFGPYYKEMPETIGDPTSQTSVDTTISAAGPHVGAEYWYSLTPKLGLQANAHVYMSLIKMSTPNGEPIDPRMSHQVGFMGSYRFTPNMTGLIGYAMRVDQMAYKVNTAPSSGNTAGTPINAGDVNESTVTGHYLNLFAEWAF